MVNKPISHRSDNRLLPQVGSPRNMTAPRQWDASSGVSLSSWRLTYKHPACLLVSVFRQFNGINYRTPLTASDMSVVCNMRSFEWQIASLSDSRRKERCASRDVRSRKKKQKTPQLKMYLWGGFNVADLATRIFTQENALAWTIVHARHTQKCICFLHACTVTLGQEPEHTHTHTHPILPSTCGKAPG